MQGNVHYQLLIISTSPHLQPFPVCFAVSREHCPQRPTTNTKDICQIRMHYKMQTHLTLRIQLYHFQSYLVFGIMYVSNPFNRPNPFRGLHSRPYESQHLTTPQPWDDSRLKSLLNTNPFASPISLDIQKQSDTHESELGLETHILVRNKLQERQPQASGFNYLALLGKRLLPSYDNQNKQSGKYPGSNTSRHMSLDERIEAALRQDNTCGLDFKLESNLDKKQRPTGEQVSVVENHNHNEHQITTKPPKSQQQSEWLIKQKGDSSLHGKEHRDIISQSKALPTKDNTISKAQRPPLQSKKDQLSAGDFPSVSYDELGLRKTPSDEHSFYPSAYNIQVIPYRTANSNQSAPIRRQDAPSLPKGQTEIILPSMESYQERPSNHEAYKQEDESDLEEPNEITVQGDKYFRIQLKMPDRL